MKRGIALFNAMVMAVIVSLTIAGLYYLFMRVFRSTEELRVYTSIREAAASGARFGASQTRFPALFERGQCINLRQEFRVQGRSERGETLITVCQIGSVAIAGREVTGVAYDPVTGATGGAAYKITSISQFPAGAPVQEARVEAVYIR